MSELSYLEKLLDGVEVEWKTLEDISIKRYHLEEPLKLAYQNFMMATFLG